MTPLEHARDLLRRGYSVIPLPPRSKRATAEGWPELRLSESDLPSVFNQPSMNIGILLGEPSGWLVDIDLDHPLAVRLAPEFLPPTEAKFGRESKPRSHWIYRVTGPVGSGKWQRPTSAPSTERMIVELRSTGLQTVAPGSVHPSGKAVRWDCDGEPASIDPDVLTAACVRLADAVLAELGETQPAPKLAVAGGTEDCGSAVERVLSRLNGVRKSSGGWRATCPGHDDRSPSLSISEGHDGRVLLKCFAGCSVESVVAGMGLAMSDLFPAPARVAVRQNPRSQSAIGGSVSRKPSASSWRPFPVDALPSGMGAFVTTVAKSIGCDPAFVGLPAIVVCAAAVGNTHRLMPKAGWTEPCVLWGVIVGDSGSQKSPALEPPLKPLRKRQSEAIKEYKRKAELHRFELEQYKGDLQEWKGKGRKAGALQPTPPREPACERYICQESTVEALADRLRSAPRGILVCRDELSAWLGGFDQYKGGRGGDVGNYLEMHRAGDVMVDRKTGDEKLIHVPNAAVSIMGGIQPDILSSSLGRKHFENGLAARLLLSMPPRRPRRWTDDEIDEAAERAWSALIERLLALQPDTDGAGDPTPKILRFSPGGKALWVEFYDRHGDEMAELTGDLAAAWSKLEAYCARFALLIHLVRVAEGDPSIERPDLADEESVRRAIQLTQWFSHEARRVYEMIGESDEARELRRMIEQIEREGGEVTVRRWQRLRSLETAEKAKHELDALVSAGFGAMHHPPPGATGGAPTEVFRLDRASGDPRATDKTPHGDAAGGVLSDTPMRYERGAADPHASATDKTPAPDAQRGVLSDDDPPPMSPPPPPADTHDGEEEGEWTA